MGFDAEPNHISMTEHLAHEWRNVPVLTDALDGIKAILQDPSGYSFSIPGNEELDPTSLVNVYEISFSYPSPEQRDPGRRDFLRVGFTLQTNGLGMPFAVFSHEIGVVRVPANSVDARLVDPVLDKKANYYPVTFKSGDLLATSETATEAGTRGEIASILQLVSREKEPKRPQIAARTPTTLRGIITKK